MQRIAQSPGSADGFKVASASHGSPTHGGAIVFAKLLIRESLWGLCKYLRCLALQGQLLLTVRTIRMSLPLVKWARAGSMPAIRGETSNELIYKRPCAMQSGGAGSPSHHPTAVVLIGTKLVYFIRTSCLRHCTIIIQRLSRNTCWAVVLQMWMDSGVQRLITRLMLHTQCMSTASTISDDVRYCSRSTGMELLGQGWAKHGVSPRMQ